MIRFECDYQEGAHPLILKRLMDTNWEQTSGYGEDVFCENARNIIRKICENHLLDIHFLVGGTQTNTTVIASILKPYQGVIAADCGHINVHETGAIESTGHKVIALDSINGKISAEQVETYYNKHWNDANHEHIVQPGMVYISQPTELGTLYSKSELMTLYSVCQRLNLPLYIDGARLGYALMSPENTISISDLAKLCDVFYIGGTKIGALFGEAIVIVNENLKKDFRYMIKQRGALLAKGRILGLQFETLLKNNLYFQIAKHAIDMAMLIQKAFIEKNIKLHVLSPTNQQFPILTRQQKDTLAKKYAFELWENINDDTFIVRFCTSWATKEEHVKALIDDIRKL